MELSHQFDNKKFMWDGKVYDNASDAHNQTEQYKTDGFEVRELIDDGKYYLFTRRVVTSVP